MRIDQLELTDFGPFANQTVGFSPGLTLLHGRNEAGKSSLLRAVRAGFFGATTTKLGDKTVRTLDGWAGARTSTAISVRATLADGGQLEFTRTNKTKSPVVGQIDGQPLNAERLASILGIDAAQYRNVFGFTLDELRAGQHSLTEAKVTEVLFGGGLGRLAAFRDLQSRVDKLSGELFKARGKNQPINTKLADIQSAAKLLRERTVTPQEYEAKQTELKELQTEVDRLDGCLTDARGERMKLDRLDKAGNVYEELQQALAEQSAIDVDQPLAESVAKEALDIQSELRQSKDQLTELTSRVSELEAELDAIELYPELEPTSHTISWLAEESARVREKRREIDRLEGQRRSIEDELSAFVDAPDELPESTRALLEQWQRQATEFDEQARQLNADLKTAKRQLAELQIAATSTTDEESREFTALGVANRWQQSVQHENKKDELRQTLQRDQSRLEGLKRDAANLVGWTEWPEDCKTPLAKPIVQERAVEQDELQSKLRDCETRCHELQAEESRLRDELDTSSASPTLVTPEQVHTARGHRDSAIDALPELMRQGIETRSSQELDSSVTEIKRSITTADNLADRLTANAQEAARVAVLQRQLLHVQRDLELADEAKAKTASQLTDWQQRWKADWQSVFADPPSPGICLEWISLTEQMEAMSQSVAETQSEYESLCSAHEQAVAEIQELIPETLASAAIDAQIAWLETTAVSIRDRQSERRRAREQQPIRELAVQELEERLDELNQHQKELDESFATWKADHTIPAATTFTDLENQLRQSDDSHQLRRQLADVEDRLRQGRNLVEEFDDAVAQLDIVDEEMRATPHELVALLAERVKQHREGTQLAKSTNRSLAEAGSRIDELRKRNAALSARLDEVFSDSKDADDSARELRAQKSVAYWKCDETIRTKNQLLSVAAGDLPLERFISELEDSDSSSRAERRSETQRLIDTLSSERQDALDRMAIIRNDVAALSDSERLDVLQTQLESDRAELRDAIDSYAPLRLLQTMLNRAIEKFGKSVRPELLESVAKIFGGLTGGEYVDVDRSLEAESLRVQHISNRWKSPAELSTGTCELLYLAVRLAFLEERSQDHEPLPVFMDDVLVNIDTNRTTAVISTLGKLAGQMQIVMLSCRDDLTHAFEQAGYSSAVHALGETEADSSRHTADNTVDDVSPPVTSELLF